MSDNPIIYDAELSLRASASQAIGSANGTGKAIGPTALVKCVVKVTSVGTGGTLDVHLEQSSDDAVADAYADIANAAFSQVSAVGLYEMYFRAAEKWVRCVGAAGTDAVTWECFITTAEK